ncbi:ABC transporter permease [uncultured Bradyrhizobium sp.]|uniref:ABC transporter permease n=1 Tax=uncultured Bradyrhizobium sp. TaxID=199684 RepID=UPI00263588E8|nr:ABC transporter permease [uncultured Bradyrhizobium sp.]
MNDLHAGIGYWRVSYLMGVRDIRQRYARSRIGQFWLTLSTGIMVGALGFVWSGLWKVSVGELLPFVAISIVVWNLISGTLSEAAAIFPATGSMFLNQGMSFSTAIYGLIWKNVLIFLHNLPIIALTMIVFWIPVRLDVLLVIPGMILVLLTLAWASYVIGIACLRFRDLTQLVQSALLIAFFVTPVMWKPAQMGAEKAYLLSFNPFAAMLSVIRKPLLGEMPTAQEWILATAIALGGFLVALPLVGYCRRRIIYWI